MAERNGPLPDPTTRGRSQSQDMVDAKEVFRLRKFLTNQLIPFRSRRGRELQSVKNCYPWKETQKQRTKVSLTLGREGRSQQRRGASSHDQCAQRMFRRNISYRAEGDSPVRVNSVGTGESTPLTSNLISAKLAGTARATNHVKT
jgi:hypothetical protein